MPYTQRIHPPGHETCASGGHDPDGCTVIDCTDEDGNVVWHSHMDAAICPEHRLNDTTPAEDHRGAEPVPVTVTEWCGTCLAHPAVAGTAR